MVETLEEKKLKITENQERELRLYFMVNRPVPTAILGESISAILSYDLDQAVVKANQLKPPNFFINYLGYKTVKELLDAIQEKGSMMVKEDIGEVATKFIQEKISIESFRNSLLLVANDYCEPKDKEILLDILKRVSLQKVEPLKI